MEALRTADIVGLARDLGWAAAGVASVERFDRAAELSHTAIAERRLAGMPWLSHERVDAAADIGRRYPWARSLISLAWAYEPAPASPARTPGRPRGRVAAYATLRPDGAAVDYHDLLGDRCRELCAAIAKRAPGARAKWFVDHGWAMDKPIAERAGIGFVGKNTTLITEIAGSYVLLAEVLSSVDLAPSRASARNCGTCQACLPACPTGALLAPGVMDANRCISYLTIEHRGSIPVELRSLMGTWVFGCDLCQEACPINQRLAPAPLTDGAAPPAHGPVPFLDLLRVLGMSEEEFTAMFARTAVMRTGRARLARNAAIALGNAGDPAAAPALVASSRDDPDPVVREAARWALEVLGVSPLASAAPGAGYASPGDASP